jgi:hypothetical protein
MQIKIILDIALYTLEWLLSKRQEIASSGNVNYYNHYGKQYGVFPKN